MGRIEFMSREEAGRRLGEHLIRNGVQGDVVLGLPRGGVVVAAGVAGALDRPLDVIVVRKVGHPRNPEFAIGALAEEGIMVLDSESFAADPETAGQVLEDERRRLAAYVARFHPAGPRSLNGKTVILVDDGLATGATMEAAVRTARKRNAGQIIVAVPVASAGGIRRLEHLADSVRALVVDPDFMAVGHYYRQFAQTSDEQVMELLRI